MERAGGSDATPGPVGIALAGLTALAIGMGIGRFAFTPILPMMQQDAGLSVRDGAWLASANYAGYFAGALSAVALRVRATTAIRAGLVIIVAVTMAMGVTQGLWTWLVLRAAAGVASAWVLVFASAWCLGRLGAAGRPALGGVVFAGVGTGLAVAGGVCLALMAAGAGSTQAWRTLGGVALVGTLATWRRLDGPGEATPPAGPGARRPARRVGLDSVLVVLSYGIFGFGYIIPATFVPAMARELVPDPLVFGWAWPAFGAAAAASTLAAARVGRLLGGNRRLWAASSLVMAAGVLLPVGWPAIGGLMVAALLVGSTFMVNTMSGMQEARALGGSHATTLMAVMTAAFAGGQIAGPLVVGYAVGLGGGFSAPLGIAGGLLLLSAAALWRPPRPSAPVSSGGGSPAPGGTSPRR